MCTYVKYSGNITSEEKIVFDVSPDSWPFFRIEMPGILIQSGLLDLFNPASGGGDCNTPLTYISSQLGWEWYLIWR